jgi:hypothetical protein
VLSRNVRFPPTPDIPCVGSPNVRYRPNTDSAGVVHPKQLIGVSL